MFYVIDNYTHSVAGQAATLQEANAIREDLEETGIFIWSIIEASDLTDLAAKTNAREQLREQLLRPNLAQGTLACVELVGALLFYQGKLWRIISAEAGHFQLQEASMLEAAHFMETTKMLMIPN